MKRIFSLFVILALTVSVFAQSPQMMSYQGIIRKITGELNSSQSVGIKIDILKDSETGPSVYREIHNTTTNENGMVTLKIGGGDIVTGTFEGIDWSSGSYFLKTEIDPTGGTNYTITGTSQLLSSPYALYSKSSAPQSLQRVLDAGNSATILLNDNNKNAVSIYSTGGNTSNTLYNGIISTISGTNGFPVACLGISNGNSLQRNYGLYGAATNAAELNTGVYGVAYGSHDNYSVWGVAYGAINGRENRGVMGYARGYTATGWNYGVTGWAGYSDYVNIAVGAYTDSSNLATFNAGVSAHATSVTPGTNYGIWSTASNGAVNYAGFFNGNVAVTGTFTQPSDEKLKGDVQPMSSILGKISALRPVSFYYKSKGASSIQLPEELQYGFVAQEMEQVFPDLVTTEVIDLNLTGSGGGNEGEQKVNTESNKQEFKGINYIGLISILTQGIKEQQEEISQLKAKNDELEIRIKTLEDLVISK
jgi:hypothetical protein